LRNSFKFQSFTDEIYLMKTFNRSLLLSCLLFFSGIVLSQELYKESDKVYGPDPLIYNGKKYTYFLPSGTGGNQFFQSEEFLEGVIKVKGKTFTGIKINYDIYNQVLLLKYDDETGAPQIIEVSEAWLEGFSLGQSGFRYIEFKGESRFYQVLGSGSQKVLYHWRKTLKLNSSVGNSQFMFSAPLKSNYVMAEDEIYSYGSKGGFIKLFDPVHKTAIKNYLRDNRINPKKSPDKVMADLMDYISNLE